MFSFIFDLDNTLYSQKDQFIKTVKNSSYLDYVCDADELYKYFQQISESTYKLHDEGLISLEDMRMIRIKEVYRKIGYELSDKEAKHWQAMYQLEQQHIALDPIVKDILDSLKENNIQIGIITNGPSDHQRMKIKSLGLNYWIDEQHILVSDDIGYSKPDSKIFTLFESRLKRKTAKYYYVGDNYQNDIQGALSVGWSPIWLNTKLSREKVSDDVIIIQTYEGLLTFIRKLVSIHR